MTLRETGMFRSPSVRRELAKDGVLSKLTKRVCEISVAKPTEATDSGKVAESETAPNEESPVDFLKDRFYIPEELKYKAEVRYDKSGSERFPFAITVIACVILVPLIYRPIRALLKRREFLIKLDAVCRRQGIALSDIDLPYRSIFSTTETESFTVTVGGKRYACKLIGALKRGSPMGIFQNGEGAIATHVRFARITLFSRVTQFEFGFHSDDQKILIINPVPKKLFCHFGNKIAEIDNGDRVGDYKIYTATAFVRAIETDTVERLR
jgi:hypothetical protein